MDDNIQSIMEGPTMDNFELDMYYIAGSTDIEYDDEGIYCWFVKGTPPEILMYARQLLMDEGLFDVEDQEVDGALVIYGYYTMMDDKDLSEATIKIKVNAKGKRRRKKVCGKGKRYNGTKCVMIKASSKRKMKVGIRKRKRTNKAKGGATKRRTSRLRNKAMKKRKSQGL